MDTVQPHTVAICVLVIGVLVILLLRSSRAFGALVGVGAVLGVAVAAAGIALLNGWV